MKYYDKRLLDVKPLNSIAKQLNYLQESVSDYTIKPEYSKFYSSCMGELLEYYYTRLETENIKIKDEISDLPF